DAGRLGRETSPYFDPTQKCYRSASVGASRVPNTRIVIDSEIHSHLIFTIQCRGCANPVQTGNGRAGLYSKTAPCLRRVSASCFTLMSCKGDCARIAMRAATPAA